MAPLPMPLLPAFAGLKLHATTTTESVLTITASLAAATAQCPDCGAESIRVHSTYDRHPRDLPWCGVPVRFILHIRRFFCAAKSCSRITFAEQHPVFLHPFAQRTIALNTALQKLGVALGGEAGARLGINLGMHASPATIVRRVRAMPLPIIPAPRVIGIDDWAIRKGKRYGTIIVDLERHCPIAILPEYTPAAITAWLTDHPTIKIIARDRASIYTEALAKGAPQAEQVADRWHLCQNLGTALQSLLAKHTKTLRNVAKELTDAKHPPTTLPEPPMELPEPPPIGHTVGPEALRQYQFDEAKRLRAAGWSFLQIAKELQINRRTARTYATAASLPRRILPQATSSVTPYLPALRAFWRDGYHEGTQLWQKLKTHGYQGSLSSIYRALKTMRVPDSPHIEPIAVERVAMRSPRQAMWLLIRADADLTDEEKAYRDTLFCHEPRIREAATLGVRFQQLIRERQADQFDMWLKDAEASGIPELRNFARSLRGDYKPVKAALSSIWSNGQTEGSVNRLKLIKRTMYGRAGFALLQRRVLYAKN